MKKIALSGKNGIGLFCLVDDEDFETLSQHKWYWHDGYAITVKHLSGSHTKKNIKQKNIVMHRLVMGVADYGTGHIIDHINRNRLDNRKKNLRLVNDQQNCWNSKGKGVLGLKGVTLDSYGSKFVAVCGHKFLGGFSDPKTAALAYDKAARVFYGEHAYLNFPLESLPKDIQVNHVDKPPLNVERKSKYLGVSFFGHGGKRVKRWRATYRKKNLGYFHTELEAANAYAEARGIPLENCK